MALNPNGKIPAIIDPNGPDGETVELFESGEILIYLAEKTGKLMGRTESEKYSVLSWLMFQMGGIGPMFGQVGFFMKFAGSKVEDPLPRERYITEARRLLQTLETALEGQDWIAGEYSIADISIVPWIRNLEFYGAREAVGLNEMPNILSYLDRFLARPAVQRGLNIPNRDAPADAA